MTPKCKTCSVELNTINISPYGTFCYCLPCGKKYHEEYLEKQSEKRRDDIKKFREANPEYLNEYYERNKECFKKASKKYYQEHPEECKEATKNWQKTHQIACKAMQSRSTAKRRGFEHNPINAYFDGSIEHHPTPQFSIHIPKELHGIRHSQEPKDYEKLRMVNERILSWLNQPLNHNSNFSLVADYTNRCEKYFGVGYFIQKIDTEEK